MRSSTAREAGETPAMARRAPEQPAFPRAHREVCVFPMFDDRGAYANRQGFRTSKYGRA
jgi:hypothetical protein